MNGKEVERLVKVETKMDAVDRRLNKVEGKLDQILTNHLPHISNQIAALTVKVAVGAFVASLLASAVVGWIFNR